MTYDEAIKHAKETSEKANAVYHVFETPDGFGFGTDQDMKSFKDAKVKATFGLECNKILECMESSLKALRDSLRSTAMAMDDNLDQILKATDEQLPLLLGETEEQSDEYANLNHRELIEQRMKGESIDTPETWIAALADCEFSTDDAKSMAENDGELLVLIRLFRILGMKDKVDEAVELLYYQD